MHAGDRVFFPFSFGPFLGFWAGFEAGCQMGLHCVPGGGMSSQQRLAMIEAIGATVVCCTPTYALRLAEVAAEHGTADRPLSESRVRMIIVAGEPGGSIPATRERIERSWGARVIDHHGATEVGPISFECLEAPGFLHLNEGEYHLRGAGPGVGSRRCADGEPGELVRDESRAHASPVIRYRTGDIVVRQIGAVRVRPDAGPGSRAASWRAPTTWSPSAGVNVYPAGIEAVVRRFPEVVGVPIDGVAAGSLRALALEIEAGDRRHRRPTSRSCSAGRRTNCVWRSDLTVPVQRRRGRDAAALRNEGAAHSSWRSELADVS